MDQDQDPYRLVLYLNIWFGSGSLSSVWIRILFFINILFLVRFARFQHAPRKNNFHLCCCAPRTTCTHLPAYRAAARAACSRSTRITRFRNAPHAAHISLLYLYICSFSAKENVVVVKGRRNIHLLPIVSAFSPFNPHWLVMIGGL